MKKITTELFIQRANKIHNNQYDYSNVDYMGMKSKINIICKIHGLFKQNPRDHVNNKSGCQMCASINSANKRKLSLEEFIERSNLKHNTKYDYSKVEYIGNREKVIIICPVHGEFEQIPADHMGGTGCAKCNGGVKYTFDYFLKIANEKHNNKFDYSSTNYIDINTDICIICPDHGTFKQTPIRHLHSNGCKMCSVDFQVNIRRQNNLQKFNRIHHGQKHISDNSFAILNDKEKFSLMLKDCGRNEMANKLGVGYNIISTRHKFFGLDIIHTNYSSHEVELSNIFKSNNIHYNLNDRTICKPKELDFYIPDYKLAIEFDGLYWHSTTFKDKNYHLNKTNLCHEQGIHLFHIFEDEWNNKKDICKSIIKGYLNKQDQIIPARKCHISEVSNKEVKQFLIDNHLQGYVNANRNIVLMFNNEIVAAMTFGKPRYNKNIEWELLRLAFKCNIKIIGGAEKLFKYFVKNYSPTNIVSYCDKRWFTGKIYEKLSFIKKGESKPTYWYTDYKTRFHRSKYQKHKLVKMGYNKNLTEAQITKDELGLNRIWDCGQDTWIWKNNPPKFMPE